MDYQLIRQNRKTLAIQIDDERVVVKAPLKYPESEIDIFLYKKRKWIEKHLSYSNKKPFFSYMDGEIFHYLGQKKIVWIKEKSIMQRVELKDDAIVVYSHRKKDDYEHNQMLLEKWIHKQAKEVFTERYTELFKLFNYRTKPALIIKKFKSRWGAYHSKFMSDYITLNQNLLMYPQKCIDYVIIHELAHKKHQNHSKSFYAFVEEKYPDWEKSKNILDGKID